MAAEERLAVVEQRAEEGRRRLAEAEEVLVETRKEKQEAVNAVENEKSVRRAATAKEDEMRELLKKTEAELSSG